MQPPQLFQFVAQAMPQGALRTELFDQRFKLRESVVGETPLLDNLPPALGHFLFGKQTRDPSPQVPGDVSITYSTATGFHRKPGAGWAASKFAPIAVDSSATEGCVIGLPSPMLGAVATRTAGSGHESGSLAPLETQGMERNYVEPESCFGASGASSAGVRRDVRGP